MLYVFLILKSGEVELPLRDSHHEIFRDSVSFIRIMGDFILHEIYLIEDLLHLQSLLVLKLFEDIFLELLGMHLQITLQITLVANSSSVVKTSLSGFF